MKRTEKIAAENSFSAELARQDVTNNRKGILPGSTASHCKKADYNVRDYLMAQGVRKASDVRCRPSDKHDWSIKVNGKLCHGETKVGTGALRYASSAEELDFDPAKIYPDVTYFAYCAEGAKLRSNPEKKGKLFRVFTREQFIECLIVTGRKGLESSLRIHQSTSGTWQLEIQPWATKQTMARLGKYEAYCKANGIPTLEQFKQALRG